MTAITRVEWDTYTPQQQFDYVQLCEAELAEANRVLAEIPDCPVHGACMPHYREWIVLRRDGVVASTKGVHLP